MAFHNPLKHMQHYYEQARLQVRKAEEALSKAKEASEKAQAPSITDTIQDAIDFARIADEQLTNAIIDIQCA